VSEGEKERKGKYAAFASPCHGMASMASMAMAHDMAYHIVLEKASQPKEKNRTIEHELQTWRQEEKKATKDPHDVDIISRHLYLNPGFIQ
jgi:hypothetical protein